METWLTRTLGVDVPLIQAPMAGVSEGLLAGAVSKAGGLGMIGIGPCTVSGVRRGTGGRGGVRRPGPTASASWPGPSSRTRRRWRQSSSQTPRWSRSASGASKSHCSDSKRRGSS